MNEDLRRLLAAKGEALAALLRTDEQHNLDCFWNNDSFDPESSPRDKNAEFRDYLRADLDLTEYLFHSLDPQPVMKRCPVCHGDGTWETECCDGSRGCSCRGERVPMGTCNVCGGSGQVEEGNFNPRANLEMIRGMSYTGSGPRR
jgi:hypothetical protein